MWRRRRGVIFADVGDNYDDYDNEIIITLMIIMISRK
jgi:hypothetical protein